MTRHSKLVDRFTSMPRDFTYNELVTLLAGFGYVEIRKGKTAGSRRAFIHKKTRHLLRLHQPHPGNELKMYQLRLVIEELRKENVL